MSAGSRGAVASLDEPPTMSIRTEFVAMPAERCEPPDPSVRRSAKPSDLDTSNIASHGMAVSSV